MPRFRGLPLVVALLGALAPTPLPAQSARFERRPYVVLNGGYGVQGSGETSTASGLGGPQASAGLGLRVARDFALRAEFGGQWFLRGDEPVLAPCAPPPAVCRAITRTEDLRAAHLLAELRLRDRPGDRMLTYLLAGPSVAWAAERQSMPSSIGVARAARSAPGATVGVGFGLRSTPLSDRGLRAEARYTALTRSAAATHSLIGVVFGFWI